MENIFLGLETAIREGNIEKGTSEAISIIDHGKSPLAIFSECIEPVLSEIGDQFSRLEIFLPEMINAASVVKAVQEVLRPIMEADKTSVSKGRVIIATVSGDLHDIGKNIVKAMLEVNGFEVQDLGVDVDPFAIMKAAKEFNANIIALSALMLPSLPYVRDVIEFVQSDQETKNRFKVIVGGGPVTKAWAAEAQADGYGDDAIEAVSIAEALSSQE